MAEIPKDRKLELLSEKPIEELTHEQIAELIPFELEKLGKLGVNPGQIAFDMFQMNCQIQSLMELVLTKEIATEDECNEIFSKKSLRTLREVREAVSANVVRNKITEGIHIKMPDDIIPGNGGI
jgi:hypothetical protein